MKIFLKNNCAAILLESENFKNFDVEVADAMMTDMQAAQALGPNVIAAGEGEFWIDADFVRALAARDADLEWQQKFTAMLEKVRPYGWSNDDLTRIRVHLTRPVSVVRKIGTREVF